MKSFVFIGSSKNLPRKSIHEMQEQRQKITRHTFVKLIGKDDANLTGMRSRPWHKNKDLFMYYFKSMYEGRRCYYLSYSGIEYIYTQEGETK